MAGTLYQSMRMKPLYIFSIALASFLLFNSCSKDIFKSYEERIEGTWELDDINRTGIGGDRDDLPFRDGSFVFTNNGGLTYTTGSGAVFKGSWDMQRGPAADNGTPTSLQITAVNFTTQEIRSEYFEQIQFTGTDKFKAWVRQGWQTYVYHFKR